MEDDSSSWVADYGMKDDGETGNLFCSRSAHDETVLPGRAQ